MSSIDHAIAEIAARQHAVFSVSQAERARSEPGPCCAGERRTGTSSRSTSRCSVLRGAPLTWNTRAMTAVLAAGPDAVLSHRAAAALWGIEGFNRGTPEVTVPRGRRYRRPDVRVHESTDLDRCSPRIREGIAVTDPSRTLLDVGRFVGDRRLERAVESARRLKLTTWPELIAVLAKHARRGRPGIRRLRRVIATNAHREDGHGQRLRAAGPRTPPRARPAGSRRAPRAPRRRRPAPGRDRPRLPGPPHRGRAGWSGAPDSTRCSNATAPARTGSPSKAGSSCASRGRRSATIPSRSSARS